MTTTGISLHFKDMSTLQDENVENHDMYFASTQIHLKIGLSQCESITAPSRGQSVAKSTAQEDREPTRSSDDIQN